MTPQHGHRYRCRAPSMQVFAKFKCPFMKNYQPIPCHQCLLHKNTGMRLSATVGLRETKSLVVGSSGKENVGVATSGGSNCPLPCDFPGGLSQVSICSRGPAGGTRRATCSWRGLSTSPPCVPVDAYMHAGQQPCEGPWCTTGIGHSGQRAVRVRCEACHCAVSVSGQA